MLSMLKALGKDVPIKTGNSSRKMEVSKKSNKKKDMLMTRYMRTAL